MTVVQLSTLSVFALFIIAGSTLFILFLVYHPRHPASKHPEPDLNQESEQQQSQIIQVNIFLHHD